MPPIAPVPHQHPQAFLQPSSTTPTLAINARVDAGAPIRSIFSLHHPISLKRTDNEATLLATEGNTVAADEDFELLWSLEAGATPIASLFTEQRGKSRYAMALAIPPRSTPSATPLARDITFVIDGSGSMAGEALDQAKSGIRKALAALRPEDRFNIIRFDRSVGALFETSMPADQSTRAAGAKFLDRLAPGGGTDMLPALKAALADKTPGGKTHLRQVVFITDGAINAASEFLVELAGTRGRSRLFFVGIGSAPDAKLLERAAQVGRGDYLAIEEREHVGAKLSALFTRLAQPLVVNLKAKWVGAAGTDISPDPLPDLYAGAPLIITAHLNAPTGALTLAGEHNGTAWTQTLKLAEARSGAGMAKLWASRKIASLDARRYAGQAIASIHDAVREVALGHGLTSEVTHLVSLESTAEGTEGKKTDVKAQWPISPPAEWAREAAEPLPFPRLGDPDAQLENAVRLDGASAEAEAPRRESVEMAYFDGATGGIIGPKSTQNVGGSTMFALLALFFAAMSVLTLKLWRHLRREYASSRWQGRRI